ncbi:plasmid mobilization relaxosome protein MobC [Lachnospiraceae bacterium ZAX-1]
MADRIHCIRKTLRLMPKEAEELAGKANGGRLCEADYLRLLITQKPNDYPQIRQLLKDLVNEANAVGNNINQITRNYNSKLYRESDRELLLAYMKKLNLLAKEVVEQIGNKAEKQ